MKIAEGDYIIFTFQPEMAEDSRGGIIISPHLLSNKLFRVLVINEGVGLLEHLQKDKPASRLIMDFANEEPLAEKATKVSEEFAKEMLKRDSFWDILNHVTDQGEEVPEFSFQELMDKMLGEEEDEG